MPKYDHVVGDEYDVLFAAALAERDGREPEPSHVYIPLRSGGWLWLVTDYHVQPPAGLVGATVIGQRGGKNAFAYHFRRTNSPTAAIAPSSSVRRHRLSLGADA